MRISIEVAVAVLLAASALTPAGAQGGADIYKSKCMACHGATGLADSAMGKALKVKPVTDPAVKKFTEAAMIEATQNGMGKMQPYKGKLTDVQIKEAVEYFHSFMK